MPFPARSVISLGTRLTLLNLLTWAHSVGAFTVSYDELIPRMSTKNTIYTVHETKVKKYRGKKNIYIYIDI